jgi:PAS domain S-box-containing protein
MHEARNDIPETTRFVRLVQALIQNSFDIIKVLDRDLKTIFVSSAVESVLGYAPRELIGTNPLQFVHPDDLDAAREEMSRIIATGEMIQTTLRARHKDGGWRHVEVIVRDLRDDDDIGGFVMNYRDVTHRIETERGLEVFRERFEKAFRSSPDSITITSAKDGEILDVNQGFVDIVGYTHDEIVGKSTTAVGIWRNPSRRAELIEELNAKGHVRDFPIDVVTRDGDVRECMVSAELLEIGQKPCILAVTRDVTLQNQRERKLRDLEETLHREQVDFVRKNVALNEVLQHLEEKKELYRHEISSRLENLIRPMLRKLRDQGHLERRDVDVLERGIQTAFGDINDYKNNIEKLTPRELDILEMIRDGRSSKQIAEALDLSSQTVHKHRQSIRRKLQIDHREINLATYLRSQ